MGLLSQLRLKQRLTILMLLIGIIPMSIIAFLSEQTAESSISQQAMAQLNSIRSIKADAIKRHFDYSTKLLETNAQLQTTINAAKELSASFNNYVSESNFSSEDINSFKQQLKTFYVEEYGAKYKLTNGKQPDIDKLMSLTDEGIALQYSYIFANEHPLGEKHNLRFIDNGNSYNDAHVKYHDDFVRTLENFGYYDIFLVDPNNGAIFYSVFKELDYATSLFTGPYANTNFATAVKQAIETKATHTADFKQYTPSYEAPASFQATPVMDGNDLVAVLVYQLPIEPINEIMTTREGMGETGESYLVGKDRLMRSDSFLDPVNHTVSASFADPKSGSVNTEATKNVFRGKSGTEIIIDYNGNPVLSSYQPLDLGDFTWAVIAEIDKAEAFEPVGELIQVVFLIGAVAAIVILVIALYTSGNIAKPVTALVDMIQQVQKTGDFSIRSTYRAKDEIGQASKAFNQLTNSLQQAFSATNHTLTKVSKGEYVPVDGHFVGEIAELQHGVNSAISDIEAATKESEQQKERATKQAQEAEQQKQIASQQAKEAEQQKIIAAEQAQEAEIQKDIAARQAQEAKEIAEQAKRDGIIAMRIKMALDKCQANVMMANNDFEIIYANDSVIEMLGGNQQTIQQVIPQLDVKTLIGASIDMFHQDPSHQRDLLTKLTTSYNTVLEINGLTFDLTATPVFDENNQRLGTVVEWFDKTLELKETEQKTRAANENLRIRQALDNVTTNAMVADANHKIIYVNDALTNTMVNAESDIKQALPNFDARALLGQTMDVFHKQPTHQRQLIDSLQHAFETEIQIANRTFSLIATPIINEQQQRIGTVVEWGDRTSELAIEGEIDQLIDNAAAGDLTQRIEEQGKQGFFLRVSEGLNKLVSISEGVINETIVTLDAMANGDLSKKITSDYQGSFDKLKLDANATVDKLTEVIGQIHDSARLVNSGAEEISNGNLDLSSRTEQQASSLEETASSMEEMTSTVRQNAEHAKEANELAHQASEKAQHGGNVVSQAVASMEEINDSSKKINDIIGVIDEIAFQTNLLALNAAVEAARAGEQGKGFAVVASEVRNLAQRSAGAAKEIKDLIRDSVAKIDDGSALVNQSGEMLNEIVDAVAIVNKMIRDIASASAEQSAGIDQVNKAIAQMDAMTQQNASLVEEASAASESMTEESRKMTSLLTFFNVER